MLDLRDRQVFLEAFRAPDGYELDHAIGTTYTLDLTALLVIPLTMAVFPCDDDRPLKDPILVLEALARTAERVTVFCQKGAIAIPSISHLLYMHLEPMVVEVAPRVAAAGRSAFHAKVWLLRYTSQDRPPHYRFLCASRNLTFDRSWDTLFAIDGTLDQDGATFERNLPLRDFIRALPDLAFKAPDADRGRAISMMSDEVPRIDFKLPPGSPFAEDGLRFHALGIPGHGRWPFPANTERALVVSPFVSQGVLAELADLADGPEQAILISRTDSLRPIADSVLGRFGEVRVLGDAFDDDGAMPPGMDSVSDLEAGDGADGDLGDHAEAGGITPASLDEARGLHAKIFVTESGRTARMWVGSANATASALPLPDGGAAGGRGRNVEFLVELQGLAKEVGIDTIMGRAGAFGLRDLAVSWRPDEPPTEEEKRRKELERRMDELRWSIANSGVRLDVERTGHDNYAMTLSGAPPDATSRWDVVAARCWPISHQSDHSRPLDPEALRQGVVFENVSPASVTSFVAFEIVGADGRIRHTQRFVLNVPLAGAPEDRAAHIMRSIIKDQAHFMRYLFLLLAEEDGGIPTDAILRLVHGGDGNDFGTSDLGWPLLEELIRAVSRSPEKIGRISRIVAELRATEDGATRVPEDFDAIWAPIEQAWSEAGEGSTR